MLHCDWCGREGGRVRRLLVFARTLRPRSGAAWGAALLVFLGAPGVGTSDLKAQLTPEDLRALSLEDLMGLEVTSVSRKPEPFVATAGAVGVITGAEVQQTGYEKIADALRYATGLQVARVDGHVWAVSARGFNVSESNKLLVQMDGRTVYTPMFSGVHWDAQDTFLHDLDRIEVIRGPGATLWGSNAVNGVISITTKDARYTQGSILSVGAGTPDRAQVAGRYGGEVPGKYYYRVYAKAFQTNDTTPLSPASGSGRVRFAQGGFRMDSAAPVEWGTWTVQGDYYEGTIAEPAGTSSLISGGNLLGRLTRRFSDSLDVTGQFYFDHVARNIDARYAQILHTYDLDTQVRYAPGNHHEIVAGVNYRSASDHEGNTGTTVFAPARRRIETASAFVQDELRWLDGKLGLILGSKAEYHESAGLELLPSARLAWRTQRSTLWAAVSRALRTPSRYDQDLRFPSAERPFLVGSRDFKPEEVLAYELGFRAQPTQSFAFDVSLFLNEYDRLRSQERRGSRLIFGNELQARTYGAEITTRWQPHRRWSLHAGYAFLGQDFSLTADSTDVTGGVQEWNDPRHSATLRSVLRLPWGMEWDVGVRYVGALPHPAQRAYTAADTRLVWRHEGGWEFALIGHNLFDPQHTEFGEENTTAEQVERTFYGTVTWEF